MIDIHCHILYGRVGPKSLEQSKFLSLREEEVDITGIFLKIFLMLEIFASCDTIKGISNNEVLSLCYSNNKPIFMTG